MNLPTPVLSLRGITQRYGALVALDEVSLDVAPGEFFGLLGPNGAGKSTLMSVTAGLRRPQSGTALIAGRPARDPSARRQLGLVPQGLALYPHLTAEENLKVFGGLYGLRGAELKGRVDELLEAVQLSDRRKGIVKTFSGGMMRRLNVAAALLHRPSLLLCDEPTVGVDPQSRNAIFELLARLNREGLTVIYSTHYMEEAARLCSRIGIIDHGKMLALGTLDELQGPAVEVVVQQRATLESVFLTLTGRALREEFPTHSFHALHFVLLSKNFAYFRRDRGSVILTFLVPFALIYLFGQIFGVNRTTGGGPSAFPLAVVDNSGSDGGRKLVAALRAQNTFRLITETPQTGGAMRPLAEADLKPMMRNDAFRFALVLPPDFTGASRIGLHLKLLSDPRNAIEAQTVTGLLEKTLFTQLPQLLGGALQARARESIGAARMERFNGRMADAIAAAFWGVRDEIYGNMQNGNFGFDSSDLAASGTGGANDIFARVKQIDREQVAGNDVTKPMATQLVGGWAMQFLLFALVASATSLFHEKEHGLFQRILSGPVPRSAILLSKFLYGICLGILQMAVLFTAGKLLFGIVIGPYLPKLILVWICAAAACSSIGMLLAAVSKTPEMARGLATFVILLMSAIGGAWFPVSFMPEFIQHLSRLTLVYWSVEGFLQVLWVHASLLEILPSLGILLGITALFLSVAWWRFTRGSIFD